MTRPAKKNYSAALKLQLARLKELNEKFVVIVQKVLQIRVKYVCNTSNWARVMVNNILLSAESAMELCAHE